MAITRNYRGVGVSKLLALSFTTLVFGVGCTKDSEDDTSSNYFASSALSTPIDCGDSVQVANKKAEAIAKRGTPDTVYLNCDLSLKDAPLRLGSFPASPGGIDTGVIDKDIVIEGSAASGMTLDCDGQRIGSVRIQSKTKDNSGNVLEMNNWIPPVDVTIQHCIISRRLAIGAVTEPGGSRDKEVAETRKENFVSRIQSVAPQNIILRDVTIEGFDVTPLNLMSGSRGVSLLNSRITGTRDTMAIQVASGSGGHLFKANKFTAKPRLLTMREQLSLDGADNTRIVGNIFEPDGGSNQGAIRIYRNCGEGGRVRQEKPIGNSILNNVFIGFNKDNSKQPVVVVGSRGQDKQLGAKVEEGNHCTADLNNGQPWFGLATDGYTDSSADNRDFAVDNMVSHNKYADMPAGMMAVAPDQSSETNDYLDSIYRKVPTNLLEDTVAVPRAQATPYATFGCYAPYAYPSPYLEHQQWTRQMLIGEQVVCLGEKRKCNNGTIEREPSTCIQTDISVLPMVWSWTGKIAGKVCTQFNDGDDAHGWSNNYLCQNSDYGLRFAGWNGARDRLIENGYTHCLSVIEPNDLNSWNNNWLCSRHDLGLLWSSEGDPSINNPSVSCVQIKEPSDPNSWNNNYLCSSKVRLH